MYIVAIGWAYVILMMAVTADSLASALATGFFLGVLPLALFVYVADSGRRRRRREAQDAADEAAASVQVDVPAVVVADQGTSQRDAGHAQTDQR